MWLGTAIDTKQPYETGGGLPIETPAPESSANLILVIGGAIGGTIAGCGVLVLCATLVYIISTRRNDVVSSGAAMQERPKRLSSNDRQ